MSPSPPSSLDQATSFKGYSFNCLALNPAASMQVAATTQFHEDGLEVETDRHFFLFPQDSNPEDFRSLPSRSADSRTR